MARVVVGLSGGVDSSVAAYLLKEQGHEVICLFMKNWHDDSVTISDECPWLEDSYDAMLVAEKLKLPFQTIDLSETYKARIVEYMFNEYQNGRTPNPDVLCNREIKYDVFLKTALELGADFVATGHYCRKESINQNGETVYRLLSGKDSNKDQSYFLCQLNQEQLKYAMFPIGHLEKSEVRKIANEQGFVTADKKDSQGLCFVGKVRLPEFLQQQLAPRKGDIVEIPSENVPVSTEESLSAMSDPFSFTEADGNVVGQHQGAYYYTIGQRKGLGVGGFEKPLFVIGTDTNRNVIYTGQGEDHPGLYRKGLFIDQKDVHWVRPDLELPPGESKEFLMRIRYRQDLQKGTLYAEKTGVYLIFDQPQKSITPGQFAAWYLDDELIGSGVISA